MSKKLPALKGVTLAEIHKEFCKRNKIKYDAANVAKDLKWNCFSVATVVAEMLEKRGVPARAVYGSWWGSYSGRPALPAHRHGWCIVNDKEVLDATRWVFEDREPYLFKAPMSKCSEYDEGSRRLRSAQRIAFPKAKEKDEIVQFTWSKDAWITLFSVIRSEDANPFRLTVPQVMWIANTDYYAFGKHIVEIYETLIARDFGAFIPTDYRKWYEHHYKR